MTNQTIGKALLLATVAAVTILTAAAFDVLRVRVLRRLDGRR